MQGTKISVERKSKKKKNNNKFVIIMSEGAQKKICLSVSSKGKKLQDSVKAIGVGIMSFDSFENCKKYYQAIVAVDSASGKCFALHSLLKLCRVHTDMIRHKHSYGLHCCLTFNSCVFFEIVNDTHFVFHLLFETRKFKIGLEIILSLVKKTILK